jgi:hypothetical protein
MTLSIKPKVFRRIRQFYTNVMLKYPNAYSVDDVHRDAQRVIDELPKVGTQLQRRNFCIIQRWYSYLVDYSKSTKWYFAYLKDDDVMIYVCDAEHARNMSDLAMLN